MNIILIPDSFKGSITSEHIIAALTAGFQQLDNAIHLIPIVASDGGEGFLSAVAAQKACKKITIPSVDPLQRSISSYYLLDGHIAYIELANCSGYELLSASERNPMNTTTLGTGIQLKHALEQGAKKIYVGLGGSATNDGGIGIAEALDYEFFDEHHHRIEPIGKQLSNIQSIQGKYTYTAEIVAVNDVQNPLYGTHGAAYTYGKQKGASSNEIAWLDAGLKHLDEMVQAQLKKSIAQEAGCGAAGGAAYGLKAFCNAHFMSGTDFLFELTQFKQTLSEQKIDAIITGEGCIDHQTAQGKLISGIIKEAQQTNTAVIGICGKNDLSKDQVLQSGFTQVIEIAPQGTPVNKSMTEAYTYIRALPSQILAAIS